MNLMTKNFAVLLSLIAGRALAAPDAAAASAELAAKNMAYVSSALAAFEKGLNGTAVTRVAHILSVRKLAYTGHQISINEASVLQKTDGADVVKLYEALCEYGDKAAQASSQAAAAEATAKAELAASFTPLKISTEKLDRAAQALASLSAEQTDAERAQFLLLFFRDTRDETKRLLEAGEQAKKSADTQLKKMADKAIEKEPLQLKKD